MTIKENFMTRLNNSEILVIGASYVEEDYTYWQGQDLNYIGFAKTYGAKEQVEFHEGNPLDFDWNDANVVNILSSCLKNKVFKEIYIDRGTIQHIENLDLILNYLFNNHLAENGNFYFPAYQEPVIQGKMRFFPGISETDYERLKSILPESSLQGIESVELDRENWITGSISIYSVCKNPCKNSKSVDNIKKKQKTCLSGEQQTNSSCSSSSTNNTLLFTHLPSNDAEIARQLQENFDQGNDEEIARQLQLQFDQENYGSFSSDFSRLSP